MIKNHMDQMREKAKNSSFRNLAKTYAMRISNEETEYEEKLDALSIIYENYFHNTDSTKAQQSMTEMNEFLMENVDFDEAGQVENLLEDKLYQLSNPNEFENLTEDFAASYMDVLKTDAVQDILMTGEVFSQLLTHHFATTQGTDNYEVIFSNYFAVVAEDRGFLSAGDPLFDNQTAFFMNDRIVGEQMATGDGVTTAFGPYTVAHTGNTGIKPFSADGEDNVILEYAWDNAGTLEIVYFTEPVEGVLRVPGDATNYGTVDRVNNTISLTSVPAGKVPANGEAIYVGYSFGLRDSEDVAKVTFTKTTSSIKVGDSKVTFIATFDANAEIRKRGSILSKYVDEVKQVVLRNSIDIRNLNKVYLAARNSITLWDKTVPVNLSADEHYASIKYSIADVIGELGKNRDKQIDVDYKAFASTRVIHMLEAIGSNNGDIYRQISPIVKGAIGLGDIEVSGKLHNGLVSVFCVPFLDQENQHYMQAEPMQAENEVIIAAVPTGEFSEIRKVAVFVVNELFRHDATTPDASTRKIHTAYTSHTGFKVLETKYFALLVIDNM